MTHHILPDFSQKWIREASSEKWKEESKIHKMWCQWKTFNPTGFCMREWNMANGFVKREQFKTQHFSTNGHFQRNNTFIQPTLISAARLSSPFWFPWFAVILTRDQEGLSGTRRSEEGENTFWTSKINLNIFLTASPFWTIEINSNISWEGCTQK